MWFCSWGGDTHKGVMGERGVHPGAAPGYEDDWIWGVALGVGSGVPEVYLHQLSFCPRPYAKATCGEGGRLP